MNFVIVVCLLTVVACYDAMEATGPALISDTCKIDEIPKRFTTECSKITCDKTADGNLTITSTLCGAGTCPSSKAPKLGTPDLTKTFPSCCPEVTCE